MYAVVQKRYGKCVFVTAGWEEAEECFRFWRKFGDGFHIAYLE